MQKSPSLYITHIIEAATQISEYVHEISEQDFSQNKLIQDGVTRQLEIIGEACSSLEKNFRETHSKIPWIQIIGMRNKLAHEYWDIDLDLIWQTVKVEVPELKNQLIELLNEIGK